MVGMAVRRVERVVDMRMLCRTVWSLVVLVDRCELLVRLAICVDIRLLPCLFSFWVCGSGPAVGTRGKEGCAVAAGPLARCCARDLLHVDGHTVRQRQRRDELVANVGDPRVTSEVGDAVNKLLSDAEVVWTA